MVRIRSAPGEIALPRDSANASWRLQGTLRWVSNAVLLAWVPRMTLVSCVRGACCYDTRLHFDESAAGAQYLQRKTSCMTDNECTSCACHQRACRRHHRDGPKNICCVDRGSNRTLLVHSIMYRFFSTICAGRSASHVAHLYGLSGASKSVRSTPRNNDGCIV